MLSRFPLATTVWSVIVLLEATAGARAQSVENQTPEKQTLEKQLLAETHPVLAADARKLGDPVRGAAIFYARALACATCHSVGDRAGAIGPDLARLDKKTTDAALVESLLEPSKVIAPLYATVVLEMNDGRIITGLPVEEYGERLVLRDPAQLEKLITLRKADIADRKKTEQSIMPAGQVNQLANRQQFLDLVRYLIELRDGGAQRARELQPPNSLDVPERPLPWQPVVQRGEVEVDGDSKYPHAVALGFDGGTVLFDANRLGIVAWWSDGFVKPRPQNYFGLWWNREGNLLEQQKLATPELSFQLTEQGEWQSFEPAATSDPNTGTRFDGYQIGKSAVRLHYRVRVGQQRITVTEDVRAELRPQWHCYVRELRFTGLPAGARAGLTLSGKTTCSTNAVSITELEAKTLEQRFVSAAAADDRPVVLRVDQCMYRGTNPAPTVLDRARLLKAPVLDDKFDRPVTPPKPLPELAANEPAPPPVSLRSGVTPKENVDEFPAATARFLRFVVTRTNDGSAPGVDELEIYGPDSKDNLSLTGKATASSVISGHAIHQIPHLNDGKLGNNHSWISAENGGGWAQIEFEQPTKMNRIVWARDRTGVCRDRLAVAYRIEVSDDGKTWKKVGDEAGRAAPENLVGAVRRDAAPGYVLESIPTPFSSCRPSDVAFRDDGVMFVTAMTEGQIWASRIPPPGQPERVKWQLYATGLYHPLGLAIVDGRLYVAQKTEITEIIDSDGDLRADHYRTAATGWGLSTGWHEYCFGLAVDPQKNLWFALNTGYFWTNPGYVNPGRWRGSILRVAHGSEKLEEMAKGCRVPNGIARGPEGNIFYTDNQGDWIQACKLAHIVPNRFYGHPETKADALPQGTYPDGRSAIWLPYERSRSTSGPVHDATQGRFGPYADQMFVGDVGYGANAGVMRIALEKVKGEYQGACFRFIDGQPSGCERMKFGPDDQLYMASLSTGLTRLKYEGKTPAALQAIHIRPRGVGFTVKLTQPLAEDANLAPERFKVRRYHYLYTGNYGSPNADETNVPVEKVELNAERTELTLTLPVETYPIGMVYAFQFGELKFASGDRLAQNEAWYTVQQIPE
ncbi:discoidin domain-containing protein [Anatilimnocola floriformis]|uniref:discoidin domain-containing protein n=1 Tax=Anatilimnocola floriformis TaxID=2948575 RepID=UPI0020C322E8|nr:discoidin domain-containing protein [Anatilimnocola floriformis]